MTQGTLYSIKQIKQLSTERENENKNKNNRVVFDEFGNELK